jgi:GDP-L-fucose synthase
MDLGKKRILITGGSGFLGSHLTSHLQQRGCEVLLRPRSSEYNLVDSGETRALYADTRPELVFHLAARVGGIGANALNPASYFHDNLLMGVNVIEQARHFGVEKTVLVGTICSYPKFAPLPFREQDLWNGYPEETNAPYGVAKKALLVMADAYRRQYGTNIVCLLPVNLYGPRDNFDLESSHVIPAMIRKFVTAREAGKSEVVLWGDGSPTREFLYADDCARALVLAAERLENSEPVNIGAGFEISVATLAALVAELVGYRGKVSWDRTRPNGQPRRMLNTERARELMGFEAATPLEVGLRQTIDWYLSRAHQSVEESLQT